MPPLLAVQATIDLRSWKRWFTGIARVDTRKVFNDLRGFVRFDQRHHWNKEEGPDQHWPGLAPSTLERRTRKRGRDKSGRNRSWPKKLMGRFPTALQLKPSAKQMLVLSRVRKFSWVHQHGGAIGNGAHLPRRQFLWISDWLLDQSRKAFEKAMLAAAQRS